MGKIAFLDKIGVTLNARTKLDASDINEIKAAVNSLYDIFDTVGSEPVGSTRNWWCLATIPTDYELITESQKWFSKVDNASLYIALGGEANVFGVTATEFSIPYYPEGTSIVQVGSNFGLGVKGGAKTHLLTKDELPAVNCVGVANQTTVIPGEIGAIKKSKVGDGNVTGNSFDTNGLGSEPNTLNIFPFPNLGSGTSINIMNPYIGAYFIIKVKNTGTTLTSDQPQIINTVPLVCSDEKTDLTASTDVPVIRFVFQTAQSFTKIVGELNTAAAGGTFTVVAKKNGVLFLSTPLTFDGGENTTRTASVPFVFTTPTVSFSVGDYVEIFITAIGAVTPGKGLKIYLM